MWALPITSSFHVTEPLCCVLCDGTDSPRGRDSGFGGNGTAASAPCYGRSRVIVSGQSVRWLSPRAGGRPRTPRRARRYDFPNRAVSSSPSRYNRTHVIHSLCGPVSRRTALPTARTRSAVGHVLEDKVSCTIRRRTVPVHPSFVIRSTGVTVLRYVGRPYVGVRTNVATRPKETPW